METQGSLCSKRPCHLLFLIIWSKGEKAVFWMEKNKASSVSGSLKFWWQLLTKLSGNTTCSAPGELGTQETFYPILSGNGNNLSLWSWDWVQTLLVRACGDGRVECPTISPDSWTRKFRVNFLPWPFWAILFTSPQNACKGTFKPSQNFRRKNYNRTVSFLWNTVGTVSLANALKTWHFPREVWTEMRFLSSYAASMFWGEK